MTRDQFISLCFIAIFLFVVYQICLIFSPFLKAIFWSGILAFAFYPLHERLKKRLKPHGTLAAILMTAAIFLFVIPPVVLLIVNLAAQAIELYQTAFAYIREGGIERLIDQIRSVPFIKRIEVNVFQWEPLKENAAAWILGSAKFAARFSAAQATTITKNLLFFVLNLFMMLFLLFVFLKDGEAIYRFIYEIAPLEAKNKKSIFGLVNETFSAVIRGQLLTGLTQASVAGIIFWFLGLPLPLFFAALTFLTALIPIIGAWAVWAPLVVHLLTLHQYTRAVTLFILGIAGISIIDNVMKPAIIGEKTKLPYFMLFFGILGGIKVYGLMGIFLAPVILSLFFALVKIYQEKYL